MVLHKTPSRRDERFKRLRNLALAVQGAVLVTTDSAKMSWEVFVLHGG